MVCDFRKLIIWKEAHELTLNLYGITKTFPDCEKYRLTDQLLRAAASIPANIAEGCGQKSTIALNRYLFISLGSIKELEYHLLLAHDLGYLAKEKYVFLAKKMQELAKMTYAFSKSSHL